MTISKELEELILMIKGYNKDPKKLTTVVSWLKHKMNCRIIKNFYDNGQTYQFDLLKEMF
jgi:hypothetical protein